jgi:proteic killer suppression protein
MIVSFRSRQLQRLYVKNDSRGVNPQHISKLRLILSALSVANKPEDMRSPERWSVHVNGNWRVTFSFLDGDAADLDYEDYH